MPAAEWGVLIADDEPAARRGVRQLLDKHPAFAVVAECRNGSEVLRSLDDSRPHVVFLDIQMPGLDGFEVVRRRTPERMPAVVFLTAYDEFALKAFEAQALDYLVKPVNEARFAATMHRLARMLRGHAAHGGDSGIAVSTTRGTVVVRLSEIELIESADNYARLWVGTRSYLVRESLDSLERRVGPRGFVRAHRQALVRTSAIREFVRTGPSEGVLILATGARVPVSRRRLAAVRVVLRKKDSV
jgi:two-component system LytT family response regulator